MYNTHSKADLTIDRGLEISTFQQTVVNLPRNTCTIHCSLCWNLYIQYILLCYLGNWNCSVCLAAATLWCYLHTLDDNDDNTDI